MKINEAVSILREHNKWRRAPAHLPEDARPAMGDPRKIGIAIDTVCDALKWAETSWNRGFQQGLESNRGLAAQAKEALKKEREAHAETNRAMTETLLVMEEREQRDEALLRQALEALERGAWNNLLAKDAVDTVIALRERLGDKA